MVCRQRQRQAHQSLARQDLHHEGVTSDANPLNKTYKYNIAVLYVSFKGLVRLWAEKSLPKPKIGLSTHRNHGNRDDPPTSNIHGMVSAMCLRYGYCSRRHLFEPMLLCCSGSTGHRPLKKACEQEYNKKSVMYQLVGLIDRVQSTLKWLTVSPCCSAKSTSFAIQTTLLRPQVWTQVPWWCVVLLLLLRETLVMCQSASVEAEMTGRHSITNDETCLASQLMTTVHCNIT